MEKFFYQNVRSGQRVGFFDTKKAAIVYQQTVNLNPELFVLHRYSTEGDQTLSRVEHEPTSAAFPWKPPRENDIPAT